MDEVGLVVADISYRMISTSLLIEGQGSGRLMIHGIIVKFRG